MATVSRLTCPDCKKVMRPAKPLPAGKKVKCPECGNIFAAGDAADDGEPGLRRPKSMASKKAPAGAEKAGKKAKQPARDAIKSAAKPKPKPKEEAPKPSSDDEEGGTYSFVDDTPKDGEEDGKPQIEYAPDMSIKDLRGPATEILVRPTNLLLIDGLIGFLGYLLLMIIMLIPAVTPLSESYGKPKDVGKLGMGLGKSTLSDLAKPKMEQGGGGGPPPGMQQPGGPGGPGGQGGMPPAGMQMGGMPNQDPDLAKKMVYLLKDDRSILEIFGIDLSALARYPLYIFFLCLFPVFLGMVYCGFLCYGAVQSQSLTSRTWGIVSSIMAMVPYSTIGAVTCIGLFIQFFLYMILDEDDTVTLILACLAGIIALLSIGAGVFAMVTLNKQEVIDGFEYEPE